MTNTHRLSAEYIKKLSIAKGADFVGIASVDRFVQVAAGCHPADLLDSVASVIVCGKVVPQGTLLTQGTLYYKTVEMIWLQLDQLALQITQEIENNGDVAIPISDRKTYYGKEEEKPHDQGKFSVEYAGAAAGLGKMGKSIFFISPQYGNFTRLVCVLTSARLEPDPLLDWNPCSDNCRLCAEACPDHVIQPGYICEQIFCRECIKVCPWLFDNTQRDNNGSCFRTLNINGLVNLGSTNEKIVVSTLGPEGTCSEYASTFFIDKNHYDGEIKLYPTFEDAVSVLLEGGADCAIIPSAYRSFADIIFQQQDSIEIADVFKLATPSLVIADLEGKSIIKKIATHASPSALAQNMFPDAELVMAKSNSAAAAMLVAEEVDACVTTIKCVEMHSLNIIHDFGVVAMGWNVLKRKNKRYVNGQV